MAQIVDNVYQPGPTTTPLSQQINRHFADLFTAGPKAGLLPRNGTAGHITLSAGLALTVDGCKVRETTDKVDHLEIPANVSGWPRWDAIIVRHLYQTADPMPPAYYAVVEGTPAAAPEYPTGIPADGLVLGYGLLADGATAYSRVVPTPREQEQYRVVTVAGLYNGQNGQYNGEAGLLAALSALEPTGGLILLDGVFAFTSTLNIPSGVEIVGVNPLAAIIGTGSSAVRLRGASGTGTMGTGNCVLTDPTADFTVLGRRSVVWLTFLDGSTAMHPVLSRTAAELTLLGPNYAGETCSYQVCNTASLRRVSIQATAAGAKAVLLQETLAARLDDCYLSSYGTRVDGVGHMQRRTVIRGCLFGALDDPPGYAVDFGDAAGAVIVENIAEGQTIRVSELDAAALVRGNVCAAVAGASPDVGDATHPFAVQHYANGAHRSAFITTAMIQDAAVTADKLAAGSVTGGKIAAGAVTDAKIEDGAVTQAKLATRCSLQYALENNVAALGDSTTIVPFDLERWSDFAPADAEVVLLPGVFRLLAVRALTLRLSATVYCGGWAPADSSDYLKLYLFKDDDQWLVLDFTQALQAPVAPESRVLTGSALIKLEVDETLSVKLKILGAAGCQLSGVDLTDNNCMRTHISIEEV